MTTPVKGMESVVATISGYQGSERFNLIKLISYAGANYVGAMSNSITHLVCCNFEGRKYNLGEKLNTIIVNHKWVEDCIKQGRRVEERPYMMQSGKEVGPLFVEDRLAAKLAFWTNNKKMLSDKSNLGIEYKRKKGVVGFKDSMDAEWTDSFLLKENLTPVADKRLRSAHKTKHNPPGLVREEHGEPSSSHLRKRRTSEHEEPSYRSSREKKIVSKRNQSKPSNKGGRLVKKSFGSTSRGVPVNELDSGSEFNDFEIAGPSNSERIIRSTMDETSEDVQVIQGGSHQSTFKGSGLCADPRNSDTEIQDEHQVEAAAGSFTAAALSCVICWTEFSSTRGILPCGHRFCYSCIQEWADHMCSRGKISTCPLCKASFISITKVEDAVTSDQKIYSQTVPRTSSTIDVLILNYQERPSFVAQFPLDACSVCYSREPVDLLIRCHLCQIRHIHSYCLDPFLSPWTCTHCKDLQMLYSRRS